MTQTPSSPDNPVQPTTVNPAAPTATASPGYDSPPSTAHLGGQPPIEAAPPPEGWQVGYERMKKRSTWLLISTIALGATTLLAGMLALGMGALALSNSGGPGDGPGGRHSELNGNPGGRGGMNDFGNGFNGQGRLNPTPTPTPTPTATTAVPRTTPTPSATP